MKRMVGVVAGSVILLMAGSPLQAQENTGYAFVVFSCHCDPYGDGEDEELHAFVSNVVSFEYLSAVPTFGISNQANDELTADGVKMYRVGTTGSVSSSFSRSEASKKRRSRIAEYRRKDYRVHTFHFSYYQD